MMLFPVPSHISERALPLGNAAGAAWVSHLPAVTKVDDRSDRRCLDLFTTSPTIAHEETQCGEMSRHIYEMDRTNYEELGRADDTAWLLWRLPTGCLNGT